VSSKSDQRGGFLAHTREDDLRLRSQLPELIHRDGLV